MKKHVWILAILVLAGVLLCGIASAAGGTCGTGVNWTLENGVLTISGEGTMTTYSGTSYYPWFNSRDSITEVMVTGNVSNIGSYAFGKRYSSDRGYDNLKCVTFSGSTSVIGEYAFAGSGLTSVSLSQNVTSIQSYAFAECSGLTSIEIPDSVTSIGNNAFSNCKGLTAVTIPGSVKALGSSAFSYCTALTDVVFENGTIRTGVSAFSNCSKLSNITIPNTVTAIDNSSFSSCTSLTDITIPDSVTSIGASAFSSCTELTDIMIPDSVTTIGASAFSSCTGLSEIIIPDSVISLGTNIFAYCSGLSSVSLPEGMTELPDSLFMSCTNLYSFKIPESVTAIGKRTFYECRILTDLSLPGNLTSIGDEAFYNCRQLTDLHLPESVTSIGTSAFYGCSGLAQNGFVIFNQCVYYYTGNGSVTIPEGIVSISNSAFSGRTGITSVTIPEGVTSIGASAFNGCTSLVSVVMPDSLTSIGDNAFSGCTKLSSVQMPDSIDSLGENVFRNCKALADENGYVVLSGTLFGYYGTSTEIAIPEGVTRIGSHVFMWSSITGNLSLPNTLTSIGNYAFYNCQNLTGTLVIPDSVISIGDYAFTNCKNIIGLQLGSGIRSIGKQAFAEDTAMFSGTSTVIIPVGAQCVTASTDASFPNGIVPVNAVYDGIYYRMVDRVFMGYSYGDIPYADGPFMAVIGSEKDVPSVSIRSSVLGVPVRAIAEYAFTGGLDKGSISDCSTVTAGALVIPDSVEYIGYNTFYNTPGITSLKLGVNVKAIAAHAFNRMNFASTEANPLVIPASVLYIGNYAFYSPNAESIVINGGTLVTETNAFQGIGAKHITLNGTMKLGDGTFSFCRQLTDVTVRADASIQGLSTAFETHLVDPSNEPDWLFVSFTVNGNGSNYSAADGVIFNGDQTQLIRYPLGKGGTYIVPETVTEIGENAFTRCYKLNSVLFSNSQVEIADNAFSNCTPTLGGENGSAVHAYASVHSLPFVVYSPTACGENLSWSLSEDGTLTISGTGDMTGYTPDIPAPWGKAVSRVVLEDGVTSVGAYAFADCTELHEIRFSNNLTSIGTYAFTGCTGLTEIVFPDALLQIGSQAFRECTGLTRIVWPEGLSSIGLSAFYGCSSIASLEDLPANITTIENYAFSGVTVPLYAELNTQTAYSLSRVSIPFAVKDTDCLFQYAISGTDVSGLNLVGVYNKTAEEITVPGYVNSIVGSPFSGCSELRKITLSGGIDSLGSSTFAGCSALSVIDMRSGIPVLSVDSTFKNCPGGASVLLPHGVSIPGGHALLGACGTHAIYALNGGTLTIYGSGAMKNYPDQQQSSYDKYEGYSYWYEKSTPWLNSAVDRIVVSEGITSIGLQAFISLTGVTSVSLPSTLTSIGESAFSGCSALASVVIPSSVTSIGDSAFDSCTRLTSITFEGDAPAIGANAFASVIADVSYRYNSTWDGHIQNYGGTLTWRKPFAPCGESTSWILEDTGVLRLRGTGAVTDATFAHFGSSITALIVSDGISELGNDLFQALTGLDTVLFEGDAPVIGTDTFSGVTANVYYPHNRMTWEEDIQLAYGGTLSWESYCTHSGLSIHTLFTGAFVEEEQPADCVTDGHVAYWQCATCGAAFTDETFSHLITEENLLIPAPGHSLIAIEGFPATCTEPGICDEIFCEVCGETIQAQEEIPALGHSVLVTIEALEPTCTEEGHTEEQVCETCGEILAVSETVPATGHLYALQGMEWSEDGTVCTFTLVCVHEDDTQILEIAAVASIQEEPSCEEMGTTLYTATAELNEQTFVETTTRTDIAATGHTPVEDPAVAPTDRETGLTAGSHCEVCGTVLTAQEVLPALWSYSEDGLTATAYNGDATELTIPEGVTTLSNDLFKGNTNITSVVIPDSVTTIGTQTFFGASALTDVWLPDSLEGIGTQTFYNTTARLHASMDSQTARVLSLRNKSFTDGDWTLRYRVTSLESEPTAVYLVGWHGEDELLALPESFGGAPLTQILTGAFQGQMQLQSVTIPDSVTVIAEDAFTGCAENLTVRSSWNAYAHTWASNHGVIWLHESHTPGVIAAVEATCLEDGLTEGSVCIECGEILIPQETVPALGHEWGEAEYIWEENNIEVTAVVVCTRDHEHMMTETVPATGEIIRQPSCEETGETIYTSDPFENELFAIQTRSVADPPASGHVWEEPVYRWNEENTELTAIHICMVNPEHEEFEIVPVTGEVTLMPTCTEMGETTYTSEAFVNPAFLKQQKTVTDVEALGHDWGEASYAWAEDHSTVTGTCICSRDSEHVHTETVSVRRVVISAPTQNDEGMYGWISADFENGAFTAQKKEGGIIPALGTLSALALPAQVREIEEEAFAGLPVQTVFIPDTCTTIGSRAFANCQNLVYVFIPSSVTRIATDAFDGCTDVLIDMAGD